MRHWFVGTMLLGACTFGEGDYAATEAGLVTVGDLQLVGSDSVEVIRTTSEGRDIRIELEVEGRPSELRIHESQWLVDGERVGTANLRHWDGKSWLDQALRFDVVSASSVGGRETAGWVVGRYQLNLVLERDKALDGSPESADSLVPPVEEPPAEAPSGASDDSIGTLTLVNRYDPSVACPSGEH